MFEYKRIPFLIRLIISPLVFLIFFILILVDLILMFAGLELDLVFNFIDWIKGK